MLPITDGTPAPRWTITRRPNGHNAYPASRNDAMPNGIVMISRKASAPATAYSSASHQPASRNHKILPIVRMPPGCLNRTAAAWCAHGVHSMVIPEVSFIAEVGHGVVAFGHPRFVGV